MRSDLTLKTTLAGLLIFVCVILLSLARVGSGLELRLAETVAGFSKGSTEPVKMQDNGIRIATFVIGEPDDGRTWAQRAFRVVQEFKKRGAKAVILQFPDLLMTDGNKKLLRALDDLGITLIWTANSYARSGWVMPPQRLLDVRWAVNSAEIERLNFFPNRLGLNPVVKVWPSSVRDNVRGATVEDLSLKLVRLMRHIPDSVKVIRLTKNLILGDVSIPVDRDGSALVRLDRPWLQRLSLIIHMEFGSNGTGTDSLEFTMWKPEGNVSVTAGDLSGASTELQGSIVILRTVGFSSGVSESLDPMLLASLAEGMLDGRGIQFQREWTMVLVLVTLLCSAVVCLRIRLAAAVALHFVALPVVLGLFYLIYIRTLLVFEIQYAVLALLLSVSILPVIRLSEELSLARRSLGEPSSV